MIRNASPPGYSSEIHIEPRVENRVFEAGMVHNTACFVRNPADVPPGSAELMISIDGRETLERMHMRDGMKADSEEVCFG